MAKGKKKEELTIEEKLEQALVPREEWPYEVPENWCWTRLRNVADWGSGGTPSRKYLDYYSGNIPWIKTGELDDCFLYDSEEKITEEAIAHSSAKLFPVESVIIARYGATIGKTGVLKIDAATNQACACAQCKHGFNNMYLFYYLRAQKEIFIKKGKGGAQPNISQEIIKNHFVPLPPLPEQQRIVDRIESLFSKLDEAKEKAQEALDSFEMRKAAILHKAFSGELTEKWREENGYSYNQWKFVNINDIGDVITGSTPNTKNEGYYGGNVPFIKPTELNQGKYVYNSVDTLSEEGKLVSRSIRKGATCVCCIGATISKCGLLQVDAVTNQQINSIVPYDFMDDEFVYYYCCSDEFKNELIENSSATTLPIINKKKMLQLPAIIPPIEEQKIIAKKLESCIDEESKIKIIIEDVIKQIEIVKKSILAKAFRGELGTNALKEENAVELLYQILER